MSSILRLTWTDHETVEALAANIVRGLRAAPYFAIVSGLPDPEDPEHGVALARAICASDDQEGARKVSFTKVQNDDAAASKGGNVTRLSRTHQALPPHTDSSYMDRPHELVVFQMVRADADGGETIMVSVDDVMRNLDIDAIAALREPIFPFGEHRRAVIYGEEFDLRLRYYEHQLKLSQRNNGAALEPRHVKALEAMDALLARSGAFHQFLVGQGEILVMNNAKVLHGRTAFASESDRLLYRIRHHADCLAERKPGGGAAPRTAAPAAPTATPAFDQAQVTALMKKRAFDEALELCAAYLLSHPDDVPALASASRALRRAGRFEEALAPMARAAELAPDDVAVQKTHGELLIRLGRDEAALATFRRVVQLDPEDDDAALSLSALLREKGERDAARAIIARVVRKNPLDASPTIQQAKPTLLRLRGMESSTYGIVGAGPGAYHTVLQGGHFSTGHLLDTRGYNENIFNILDDNINQFASVPAADIIINTISCPDAERGSLLSAARFLDGCGDTPVINDPRAVLKTAREQNHLRFQAIDGVAFPLTERLRMDEGAAERMAATLKGLGFAYPIILRKAGSQTGLSVKLAKTDADVATYFEAAAPGSEHYAIQYQDLQKASGLFNKMRLFFVNGDPYPVANLHLDDWSIHSGDRYRVMKKNKWTQREEEAYLDDPIAYLGTENVERLRRIRDLMKLDFFGIDFTLTASGGIFVFEANPAMRHNYDHIEAFPYTEPHLKRISRAFDLMVRRRIEAAEAARRETRASA